MRIFSLVCTDRDGVNKRRADCSGGREQYFTWKEILQHQHFPLEGPARCLAFVAFDLGRFVDIHNNIRDKSVCTNTTPNVDKGFHEAAAGYEKGNKPCSASSGVSCPNETCFESSDIPDTKRRGKAGVGWKHQPPLSCHPATLSCSPTCLIVSASSFVGDPSSSCPRRHSVGDWPISTTSDSRPVHNAIDGVNFM